MFTGLIETTGRITARKALQDGMHFSVECRFDSGVYQMGESIAVDGVCITVEGFDAQSINFSISSETLKRSTIGTKNVGDKVHLERALRLGDRLGGHIVQGHVDGIGRVVRVIPRGAGADLSIGIPDAFRRYVVEKGSLAVHGVSLTVAKVDAGTATISLIPATLKTTYLGELKPGDAVNLEVDIMAKYIESILANRDGGVNEDKLKAWGFE